MHVLMELVFEKLELMGPGGGLELFLLDLMSELVDGLEEGILLRMMGSLGCFMVVLKFGDDWVWMIELGLKRVDEWGSLIEVGLEWLDLGLVVVEFLIKCWGKGMDLGLVLGDHLIMVDVFGLKVLNLGLKVLNEGLKCLDFGWKFKDLGLKLFDLVLFLKGLLLLKLESILLLLPSYL